MKRIYDMEKKPFVYVFNSANVSYLYDVNTSSLIKIKQSISDAIKSGNYCSDDDCKNLIDRGYLTPKDNSDIIIEHPANSIVEQYLDSNVQQLILQVTQNCNLRCKYCVYSGSYSNRVHNNKRMDLCTALNAVDFFTEHSSMTNTANISFYGGEPLLEIDLIKKVVESCEYKLKGKEIRYNITSNATLLSRASIEFFQKYNFALNISLDGPRDIQNHSRVFADGEKGTFDVIMKNIRLIENEYPTFLNNVSFNAVIDTKNDFACTSNFFTYDFFKDAVVTSTGVSDREAKGDVTLQNIFYVNYNYEIFKSFLASIGKLDGQYVSKLVKTYLNNLKSDIHDRITGNYRRSGYCHPNGPCLAGANRLFVTVDGDFYPCERVSETNNVYNIGNLVSGFNVDKVKTLLNTGKINEEECKNCWAINLCGTCAADFGDENGLSAEKKHEKCKKARLEVQAKLKEYCTLREYGYYFDE